MTKNIAHRGFSGRYPENIMLAFQKAIEEGADGIELDVHLTRDGVPVIIHDERLERTTNGTGFVKDQTLAQLRLLDAGSGIGSDNGRIPTLEEYLYLVRDAGILTNIELKTDDILDPGIEQKVITLLKVFDLVDRVIISSFNYETVFRMKSALPEVRCGFLTERWCPEMIPHLKVAGIEYIHPWYGCVTPERMAEAKDCGIGVNTWTVNDEADIREMFLMGVDAVITNYPDRVNRVKKKLCGD